MKRKLFFLGLFISVSASAEWLKAADTSETTEYIDLSTIAKTEKGTFIFSKLSDLTQPLTLTAGKTFRSAVAKYETDCEGQKIRILAITTYDEQMGQGRVVQDSKVKDESWDPTPPKSLNNRLFTIVCRNRPADSQ